MATQLSVTLKSDSMDTLTTGAVQHLQLKLPTLPEPQQGALSYGLYISANPNLDQRFCEVAGKVVHITASFSEKVEGKVSLRGQGTPNLSWEVDYPSDTTTDFYQRTFTLFVPANQMANEIQVKMVVTPEKAEEKMKWQNGNNIHINMGNFGHMAFVKVEAVSFS